MGTIGNDPLVTGVEIALQAGLDNLPTASLGMALSHGVWVKIGC